MDYKKFLELCKRSKTGEKVSKDDWDMDYVIDTVMEINDEYEFSWDKQVIIPEDEQLFQDMFEASKQLIQKIGMYNLSTSRVISFTEEEIEEGAAALFKGIGDTLRPGAVPAEVKLPPASVDILSIEVTGLILAALFAFHTVTAPFKKFRRKWSVKAYI